MSKKLRPAQISKFTVPCSFGGDNSDVTIYIGNPESKHHPIFFQNKFIQEARGGAIPPSILDSLEKLKQLSEENGVPFVELCKYALGNVDEAMSDQKQVEEKHAEMQSIADQSEVVEEDAHAQNADVNTEVSVENVAVQSDVSAEQNTNNVAENDGNISENEEV